MENARTVLDGGGPPGVVEQVCLHQLNAWRCRHNGVALDRVALGADGPADAVPRLHRLRADVEGNVAARTRHQDLCHGSSCTQLF